MRAGDDRTTHVQTAASPKAQRAAHYKNSPPAPTVRRAAASAKLLLFEPLFGQTARRRMTVFCRRQFLARRRIMIRRAVFFTAAPTPRTTTSCADNEFPTEVQATRKNIVACGVFQTPARTPGTLFRVRGSGLGHIYSGQSFSGGAKSAIAPSRLWKAGDNDHALNVAHIGRHDLEMALAVHKSWRACNPVIGNGRLQNTPIGLIDDADRIRHGVAGLIDGRARKQPVMYGLLRCRIDEHRAQAEIDKVRADSGPCLTREKIHTGIIVGTTMRRKPIVVLCDRVVTLLGNDEESIGHLGVLVVVRLSAGSIFYRPSNNLHIPPLPQSP